MARLQLFLFGPLQVVLDDQPVTDFAYDKVRALLAYLAAEPDRPHRREVLAGLFWPEQDERLARNSLSQALWSLRRALADQDATPPYLLSTRESIQLNPASDRWVDVSEFMALLDACDEQERCRGGRLCRSCADRLERAVELYRGSFLEQFSVADSVAFEEWALVKREQYHRRVCQALTRLIDYCEQCGQPDRASEYARRLVQLDPWEEEAHRRLMRALAATGRRAAAVEQYERCRQVLEDDLGLEPEDETKALYQQIKDASRPFTPPPAGSSAPMSRRVLLPAQSTPFVGRERELAEIERLIAGADSRLITLIGPGGIGKTRLAIQAAGAAADLFADGVYFVPLAGLGSAAHIATTIGDALGLSFHGQARPDEQLLTYLRGRELLLVLDNFEHLLDGTALVTELLKHAPQLEILVTSRERLNLRNEWVVEVDGLSLPEDDERVERSAAVQLFAQSARKAHSAFSLDDDRACVARICRLVDGIPLAIELAAAWVPVLSCEEIAREIEKSVDFLTTALRDMPERHRSMRAVFDHSWRLLSEHEQRMFRRLSVFRGGFRRAAAEYVAGPSLPVLSALVTKSLLRRNPSARYEIHELLRQYGEDKLDELPEEADVVRDRHCSHFTNLLALREADLKGHNQEAALEELAGEIENLRAAWHWAVERVRPDAIARALPALWLFFEITGRYREGEQTFRHAVSALEHMPDGDGRDDAERALGLGRALAMQGALLFRLGVYDESRATVERGVAVLRSLDVPGDVGLVLNFQAVSAHVAQDYLGERQSLQESIAAFTVAGDRWGAAYSMNDLGMVSLLLGDDDEARRLHQQSLDIFREIGDRRGMAFALRNRGVVACRFGEHMLARQLLEESLAIRRAIGNRWGIADSLNQLGIVARSIGACEEAASYFLDALQTAMEIQAFQVVMEVLVEYAALLVLQARHDQVVDILVTILDHPASSAAVQDQVARMLRELDARPEYPPLPVGFERSNRALDELARNLLRERAALPVAY